MRLSDDALINLVEKSEDLRLKAYPDPATGGAPWTIGYGHTKGVKQGDTCSQTEAVCWLWQDVREAEKGVEDHVTVPLTQWQFDALVDFTFNVGVANFASSTLLKLLNAGDYIGAGHQFERWKYGGGHILPGLITRRAAETVWFERAE